MFSGGAVLWWLTLSTVVGLLEGRLTHGVLGWINRLSGVVILGFGAYVLLVLIGG